MARSRLILFFSLALLLVSTASVSAQSQAPSQPGPNGLAWPQYHGKTSPDCSPVNVDLTVYACDYPSDGSFVTWLLGASDWTMLTYKDGLAPEMHWSPDGAAYFRQYGQPAPAYSVLSGGVFTSLLPDPSEISFPNPGAIPDQFCGTWVRHGEQLTISCLASNPEMADPRKANVHINGRTYVWCVDPTTGQRHPEPCDMMRGNDIIPGGSVEERAEQSADPDVVSLIATVTLSNSKSDQERTTSVLSMAPGSMLAVNGKPTYCHAGTDPAFGQQYCGA